MSALRTRVKVEYLFPLLIFLIILAIFVRAIDFGLDVAAPSTRVQFHAIPTALSALYFDWPFDYTAKAHVAWFFQGKTQQFVDITISQILSPEFEHDETRYYWVADDRGLADYVAAAFWLFGPFLKSLFYLYFLIVLCSSSFFMYSFRENARALPFLVCYLLALLCALPIWVIATSTAQFAEASIHLSESRLFSLLAVLPAAHIYFFTTQSGRISLAEIVALIAQTLIFIELIHARTSVQWILIGLLFLLLSQVILRAITRGPVRRKVFCGAVLAGAFVALIAYQKVSYNSAYFNDVGPRTFWHNVLMGLAANDFFKEKLEINGDDASALSAVIKHRILPNDPEQTLDLSSVVRGALNSLGGHGKYDWVEHEAQAKILFFEQFHENPRQFVRTYLVDKVYQALSCFAFTLGLDAALSDSCGTRDSGRPSIGLFTLILALCTYVVCLGLVHFGVIKGVELNETLTLAGVLFPFSTLPYVIVYPSVVTQAGSMLVIAIVFFAAAIWAGQESAKLLAQRSRGQA